MSVRVPRLPSILWGALAVAATVVSLLLRRRVPFLAYGSPYDDLLYLRGATNLVHGQWLGPYDWYTLAKGPSYPAFIAVAFKAGISLRLAEQLTYLVAAAAVAACVWIVTRRPPLAVVAYVLLALDPVNFSVTNTVIFRDGWYSSVALLLVALVFLSVYGAVTRGHWAWVVPVSVLAGLVGAVYWLCREEGPWLLPALLVIAIGMPLAAAARAWRRRRARPTEVPGTRYWLGRGGRVVVALAVIGVCAAVPVGAVAWENNRHYGVALTNDLTGGNFARAFADWTRVDAGPTTPNIPLSTAQREAVYRISPAARELEQYLETPTNGFRGLSCHIVHVCDDITGAFTVWAVRDAAYSAGHFGTAPDAQAYFGQVDRDIVAACTSGELTCSRRLPTSLQSLQRFQLDRFATSFRLAAGRVLSSQGFGTTSSRDKPIGPDLRSVYTAVVHGIPPTQEDATAQLERFRSVAWQYDALAKAYVLVTPVLLVLALLGLIWSLVRPRWPRFCLAVLTVAFVVATGSRLAFVALLDTTQFRTGDIRYQLPSHAMLMGAAVVGAALLADLLLNRRGSRRAAHGEPDPVNQPVTEPATEPVSEA